MTTKILTPEWASTDGTLKLYLGDCLEVMRAMPDASVDVVVTDPPGGLTSGNLAVGLDNCLSWLLLQEPPEEK